jgi:predicted nucleotidyltransferase
MQPTIDRVQTAIPIPMERIVEFCRRWGLSELSLFGSILREDFGPDSDVDVLVSYGRDWPHGLFEWARMREELREMFGRETDLTSRPGLERSRNASRRQSILNSARVIYHAA